jgi:hypothetical protein
METTERNSRMWVDLFTSETQAKSARHAVTERARLYMEAGLPLDQVLDALKISRATWYRRVQEHDDWRDDNARAGAEVSKRLGHDATARALGD